MKESHLIYCILYIFTVVRSSYESYQEYADKDNEISGSDSFSSSDCWMTLNTTEHFKVMDEIDDRYAEIRNDTQDSVVASDFDKLMIDGFISSRGVALRELYAHHHYPGMIPSGINLGGYCMLRMPESILFFHRMKLRNNTFFRIDHLHNDLANMVLNVNLSLNDLHLKGAYERSLTDRDPSVLIYAPTLGNVEFLLKDVKYRMEGRYRLTKNRLLIELISSEMKFDDILMTYINQAIENQALRVERETLGAFISRLKTDLDKWLKDYFNDFMINTEMDGLVNLDKLEKYDKEKETVLEEYTDNALNKIGARIRQLNAQAIQVPMFTFKAINGLRIKLYDGVLRGLDSIYRHSVATGIKHRGVRCINTIVGFSNLKVVYKYEAVIPTGVPPQTGVLTLSANELSGHLALSMVNNPESIDLDIEFLDQLKPESLTVEGGANIMISNFRHLLEHQIISVMSNTLIYGISMLKSLPRCEPFVKGQIAMNKYRDRLEEITQKQNDDSSNDIQSTLIVPDSKYDDVNSPENKAALRSTKKLQTTVHRKQSNETKGTRKKLRKLNRRNIQDM